MTMSDSDQPQTDLPGAAASADGEAPAKPRRKRAATQRSKRARPQYNQALL